MSEDEVTAVRRAPHMERYTNIHPYRTEERRDGCQVTLTIGVQSFILSDGAENHHESRAAAEWSRRQLCLALDTLRSEVIVECAKAVEAEMAKGRANYDPSASYSAGDMHEAYYTAGHRAIAAILTLRTKP